MHDVLNIIKNIESIYSSSASFTILKDFERVLDKLDIYVFPNWIDGELIDGPKIERHWVTCSFMWTSEKMPDPSGGMRLVDYDCKVSYQKSKLITPKKINTPDDIRPGTKKGKLIGEPIWIVTIKMPKQLLSDIYGGFLEEITSDIEDNFVAGTTDASGDALQSDASLDDIGAELGDL
jgi:hypothetical protein